MSRSARPVLTTAAGDWFHPVDGGAGSLLRVAEGVAADAVRRVRDLGLPGLLPIGNVVQEQGQVWLRTPQPPGPTLDDLLTTPSEAARLTSGDAVAVLRVAIPTLLALHARGLTHGGLDSGAILFDPDGAPMLVMVDTGPADPGQDAGDVAGLAWALADAWCADDAAGAALLRHCGDIAESAGLTAALATLPPAVDQGQARRQAVRTWAARVDGVPAPRSEPDQPSAATVRS